MDDIADSAFFATIREATSFFIVRHGQSVGNASRLFQGKLDMPLDDRGRAQARGIGQWLAKEAVDTVFSSPLLRAAETARLVAAECSLPGIHFDPAFSEIDTGIFTGLGFEESRERHPEVKLAITSNAEVNAPMLAINHRLGFAPYRHDGLYQVGAQSLRDFLATRSTTPEEASQ